MKDTYLITRPRLTAYLIQEGHTPAPVINPYDPDRQAWEIELNPETFKAMQAYFTEIGKPLPVTLQKKVKLFAGNGGVQ